jgi:hypothetical protein
MQVRIVTSLWCHVVLYAEDGCDEFHGNVSNHLQTYNITTPNITVYISTTLKMSILMQWETISESGLVRHNMATWLGAPGGTNMNVRYGLEPSTNCESQRMRQRGEAGGCHKQSVGVICAHSRVKSRYNAYSVRHTVFENKGGHGNENIFNV